MTEEKQADNQKAAEGNGVSFVLQKIYLKDLSYEAPMGAAAFKLSWQPKINQDMNMSTSKVEDNIYEVVLKMTIDVVNEEKTVFLVEVQQAGLFAVSNASGPQLTQVLNTMCPQILYPYLREVVDGCAIKGGFPALALPPINFDMLFAQAMQQQAAQKNQEAPSSVN